MQLDLRSAIYVERNFFLVGGLIIDLRAFSLIPESVIDQRPYGNLVFINQKVVPTISRYASVYVDQFFSQYLIGICIRYGI